MQRFTMNASNGSVVPIESKDGVWGKYGEMDYEMSTLRYEKEEALEQIAALHKEIENLKAKFYKDPIDAFNKTEVKDA